MKVHPRVDESQFSPEQGGTEVTLPHGSTLADFSRIGKSLFSDDAMGRTARGCPACTSGWALFIHEQLEDVVTVDLEEMEMVEAV